jgi:NAD(P)-dependent dehydrogenase (short-subunit alcohol dehydrogenase family)
VNAVGAALVTRAAIPALRAARGRAIYLSSEVVLEPRAGLVPYGASKCALDHVIAGARIECPEVLFTRVIVGATGGTDLGVHTPRETLAEYFSIWRDDGYRSAGLMTPSEVANEVLHLVESEVSIFDLHVQPR